MLLLYLWSGSGGSDTVVTRVIRTRSKGTVPGKRADHIITNEAAKQTKLSDNAYCCKSRIPPRIITNEAAKQTKLSDNVCVPISSELPSKETLQSGCCLSTLPRNFKNRVLSSVILFFKLCKQESCGTYVLHT